MAAPNGSLTEVLPEQGIVFHDGNVMPFPILCKPKLLPVKSFSLERLEKLEKKIKQEVQQRRQEERRRRQEQNTFGTAQHTNNGRAPTLSSAASPGAGVGLPPPLPKPQANRPILRPQKPDTASTPAPNLPLADGQTSSRPSAAATAPPGASPLLPLPTTPPPAMEVVPSPPPAPVLPDAIVFPPEKVIDVVAEAESAAVPPSALELELQAMDAETLQQAAEL